MGAIKQFIIFIIHYLTKLLRYMLSKSMTLDRYLHKDFSILQHNKKVINSTKKHDMYAYPDEVYYLNQYWQYINSFMISNDIGAKGKFLDLGCGQGRLSVPIAKWCKLEGGIVDAVDISTYALNDAEKYASNHNVDNVNFINSDIKNYVSNIKDNYYDIVFMLEVVFFLPNYIDVLQGITRILKPGGGLVVSFRSQYFNLLYSVKNGLWGSADTVLNKRTGDILGGGMQFNWHTSSEVLKILNSMKYDVKNIVGIGSASGIVGDPNENIVRPSYLTFEEKSRLMTVEKEIGEYLPDTGRYMLAIATKQI